MALDPDRKKWMPGAERLTPKYPGGRPMGIARGRAVWHTTESGVGDRSFYAVHRYLKMKGSEPHILWDPTTGRIGQYFPANRSGRALANWGWHKANRTGRRTIQIEVMGRSVDKPLKNGECKGLDELLEWLDSWGISRNWPGGNPKPYPDSYGYGNGDRSGTKWLTKNGNFGHSQVPGNTHGDPGPVDLDKWVKKDLPKVSLAKVIEAAKADPKAPQGDTTYPRYVMRVERALVKEGLLDKAYADGSYGTLTKQAYRKWQRSLGYTKPDADGIPGKVSLTKLGKKWGFRVI